MSLRLVKDVLDKVYKPYIGYEAWFHLLLGQILFIQEKEFARYLLCDFIKRFPLYVDLKVSYA